MIIGMGKGLEALNRCIRFNEVELKDDSLAKDLSIIEKELKALELIDKYDIDVYFLKTCSYDQFVYRTYSSISEKDFDFLQKVFNVKYRDTGCGGLKPL